MHPILANWDASSSSVIWNSSDQEPHLSTAPLSLNSKRQLAFERQGGESTGWLREAWLKEHTNRNSVLISVKHWSARMTANIWLPEIVSIACLDFQIGQRRIIPTFHVFRRHVGQTQHVSLGYAKWQSITRIHAGWGHSQQKPPSGNDDSNQVLQASAAAVVLLVAGIREEDHSFNKGVSVPTLRARKHNWSWRGDVFR